MVICLPFLAWGDIITKDMKTQLQNAVYDAVGASVFTDNFDGCKDHGKYANEYTIDRRCYLTDEMKAAKPFDSVVAFVDANYDIYCTGSIIKDTTDNNLYVYTAAHCVQRDRFSQRRILLNNGDTLIVEPVYVGIVKDFDIGFLRGELISVDAAVFKISQTYDHDIPFAYIANKNNTDNVNIVGFGSLPIMSDKQIKDAKQAFASTLKQSSDILNNAEYAKMFALTLPTDQELKGSFHCKISNKSKSNNKYCQTWHGDSGAPIFDENGKVIAIHARGKGYKAAISNEEYAEISLSKFANPDTETISNKAHSKIIPIIYAPAKIYDKAKKYLNDNTK